MIDLTKITTPFGLLDDETKSALRNCRDCLQYWAYPGEWSDIVSTMFYDGMSFGKMIVYRQEPQPREYEAWQVIFADGAHYGTPFPSRHVADGHAESIGGRVIRLTGRDE